MSEGRMFGQFQPDIGQYWFVIVNSSGEDNTHKASGLWHQASGNFCLKAYFRTN